MFYPRWAAFELSSANSQSCLCVGIFDEIPGKVVALLLQTNYRDERAVVPYSRCGRLPAVVM